MSLPKHKVEVRKLRGRSSVVDKLRRRASAEHAVRVVASLNADLQHSTAEYSFEVWRHIIRGGAHHMARLKAPANAVGVLAGAAVDILPAYEPEHQDARAALEALFRKDEPDAA